MSTIVHFDVPADDVQRAKSFYETMFGWQFNAPPGFEDYYLFETTGSDGTPDVGGGLGKRQEGQQITVYIGVDSVDDYAAKVEGNGGKILQPKMAVPGWGYMVMCQDTEGNTFGLWQEDSAALA